MVGEILLLTMFVLLIIGLLSGHPLGFALGGIAVLIGYIGWGFSAFNILPVQVFAVMNNYMLIAIPMFVLMANFLTYSGVADGLFEAVRLLFGPVRGGLAVAIILVSTVFAATTGVVGASVLTMGLLALPILSKYKYDKGLATGVICAGGSLGILIPPSIMLVTMSTLAQVSLTKLFLACFLPGFTLSVVYIIYILGSCLLKKEKGPAMSKEETAAIPRSKIIRDVLINLIPPLLLIIAVLGTIFFGIATPTEASACGAAFALILTICYRNFSWKMVMNSVIDTLKTSAMCFIIMFAANYFCAIFLGLGGAKAVSGFVASVGLGKWGAYILMMVLVFILGMFIDWIGIVTIVMPIFLPIMQSYNFDTIWLCATMATLLQTCFMTPPFGFALFYVKGLLPEGYAMVDVYRGIVPFITAVVIVTVIVTIFPDIITFLPNLMSN